MWPFTASPPPPQCPIDHSAARRPGPVQAGDLSPAREISSIPRWLPPNAESADSNSIALPPTACPARSAPSPSSSNSSATPDPSSPPPPKQENWVYPSPLSFYSALERKKRDPQAGDMPIVVPIHNAVNEKVWNDVLEWERKDGGVTDVDEVNGRGSRLVSFIGRPKDLSPRARWLSLIGYSTPFDRHDWIIDRPIPNSVSGESIRIRYIIDFYTGRLPHMLSPDAGPTSLSSSAQGEGGNGSEEMFRPNLAFYLDVRPAVDGWEGVRMRARRFGRRWFGVGEDKVGDGKVQGQ